MTRTTLILDDACMKKLKRLALKQDRTLTSLVNELLVEGIQRREQRQSGSRVEIPTFSMGAPNIDLADRDALEDAMSD